MTIRVLDSAKEDLCRGCLFYEYQGEGVGDYFFNSLFADIDALNKYAGIHVQVFGFYRLLAKCFPNAVYYKIEGGSVVVYRVIDLRRNPDYIRKVLKA
ncbi:MAG: type II toxin-antitoxin system RelE/ParE family toxin [Kiritimatiellae bacterium]|nr:type II toxin-antitoxin system RelE/ParE family toxin [Kiritimatiellia bacterium]